MKSVITITIKELKDFFISPIAYVAIGAFLIITGISFMKDFFIDNQADMRTFFELVPILLIILVPAITMRSWSEEKREGTLEVLNTMPISEWQLIISKFLSNFLFLVLSLLLTLSLPITVNVLGNPDNGVIIAGYIGLLFVAAAYTVIGQFVSINTQNQIISLILSAATIGFLYILGEASFLQFLPSSLRVYSEALGLGAHFKSIAKGVIDTRDVLYYLSIIIVLFVFISKSLHRIKKIGR